DADPGDVLLGDAGQLGDESGVGAVPVAAPDEVLAGGIEMRVDLDVAEAPIAARAAQPLAEAANQGKGDVMVAAERGREGAALDDGADRPRDRRRAALDV